MTRTSLVVALLAAAIAPAGASAATIHVTTTADSGAGSLRQAITDAQAPGPDDIVFDAAQGTITIGSTQLPALATGTTVTATRTDGVPDVELRCTDPSLGHTGLQAGAGQTGVVITGVSITNCTNGVFVLGGGGLTAARLVDRPESHRDARRQHAQRRRGLGGREHRRRRTVRRTTGTSSWATASASRPSTLPPGPSSGATRSATRERTASSFTNADGVVVQDNVVTGNAANGIILFRGEGCRHPGQPRGHGRGRRHGAVQRLRRHQPQGHGRRHRSVARDPATATSSPAPRGRSLRDLHPAARRRARHPHGHRRQPHRDDRVGPRRAHAGGLRRDPRRRRRRHDDRRDRAGRRQPRRRLRATSGSRSSSARPGR